LNDGLKGLSLMGDCDESMGLEKLFCTYLHYDIDDGDDSTRDR